MYMPQQLPARQFIITLTTLPDVHLQVYYNGTSLPNLRFVEQPYVGTLTGTF